MTLTLTIGSASSAGKAERNEDALACVTPDAAQLLGKGALFALADGVSGCADGRLAATSSVRAVAADYYATPETWEVATALDRLLNAHNRWLRAQGKPLLAALTTLVLRGRRFTVAHVGDCRLYRLSAGRLARLTVEHVWEEATMRHVLKRALGLDEHLVVDFCDGDSAEGDVFLLASDGVWTSLPDVHIGELLRNQPEPQHACDALLAAALEAGARDNLSALVVRVDGLPAANLGDELARGNCLPLPPRLRPGQRFEALQIETVLADSPGSLAYRVRDDHGLAWVMKTLPPTLEGDADAAQALLVEEWLQKRLSPPHFAEVKAGVARQHLYYLLRWYEGEALTNRRQRSEPMSADEGVAIGLRLARALGQLHRLNIVHRDIKPDNLHWGADGKLRLLDLGVAHCPGLTHRPFTPGTPSYMAPELFAGAEASPQSDLYAAGVTLYWLLTGRFPYGEVEAFQRPQFGAPTLPSRYRPDLPGWLESVLLKAIDKDPARRFETAEELLLALEHGEARPLSVRRHTPWAERAPLRVWRGVALGSLGLNLLFLYWLLLR